ncbi:kit ligand a isoform X2 [Neoarius graeffei]|uniref:kit ligand a isoform X2 n=1 Tax=Neoarius graeffei TaxID=443677 RepID=UPI00298C0DCA|nr:kit ligand a isoform X2 [Neoarius graeffei]
MKKSKIWIRTCVHLLLYITVAAYPSEIGNPITDDIKKISLLKQNIPKDYKITVQYLPKEVSGMCWVKLNIFHLEESLKDLAQKFGNISSNKDYIGTFVQMLQEMRYIIGHGLEDSMLEFQCHYREEKWLTPRYFEFVEDFFNTANSSREVEDCEPPPCPTTIKTKVTTTIVTAAPTQHHSRGGNLSTEDTKETPSHMTLPVVVQRSLFSLLFLPIIAAMLLLFWKVKSRRNTPSAQSRTESPPLFVGAEPSAPALEDEISEKLNNSCTV